MLKTKAAESDFIDKLDGMATSRTCSCGASPKRRKTCPHTPSPTRKIQQATRSSQQPAEVIEDPQGRLLQLPPSASRKRKPEEHGQETCPPLPNKRRHNTERANIALKQKPGHAPAQAQDRNQEQEQAAWSSVEDWVQVKPEHYEILNSQPVLLASYFANMANEQSQALKRSSSNLSKSYTQSVRDRELPRARSPQHQSNMRTYGMFMDVDTTFTITTGSQELCHELLEQKYMLPSWFISGTAFLRMLTVFSGRNEASIVKAITRYIVPSPEVLSIECYRNFDHIIESNNASWDKCGVIHGPIPKPDIALGVNMSTFSDTEMNKLRYHSTINTPTNFSEEMYFPFLICEVKSSRVPLQEAERQAMHSASIAVRAIVELFRRNGDERQLDGEILVFSIAQNDSAARIFGHFPQFKDDKVTFHRRIIRATDFLADSYGDEWTRTFQFGLALCELFFPVHLKRVRDALIKFNEPPVESFPAHLIPEGLQDAPASSQEGGSFKRPKLPSSVIQQNTTLLEEVAALRAHMEQQLRESKEQQKKNDAQLERQREESKEQLERQREESKEQLERQREDSAEQLRHLREVIDLLKQSQVRST